MTILNYIKEINHDNKSRIYLLKNIFYCFLIFSLYFLSIGRDYFQIDSSGGLDLRNRIVGARLLKAQKDPYFYKWKEKDPEIFLDVGDDINIIVNRVTVPPSLLLIISKISDINYSKIRLGYLYLNYFMFFIILFIFIKLNNNINIKILVLIFGALYINIVPAWFLHMDRGQTYLIYTFLLSLAYFLIKSKQRILSAVLLSVNIWVRPNFIIFIFPFLFQKLKNSKKESIIKNLIKDKFLLITFFITGILILYSCFFQRYEWNSYFRATNMWSDFQNNGELKSRENKVEVKYPAIIEGKTVNYYTLMDRDIDDENFSFQKLAKQALNLKSKSYQLIILYLLVLCLLSYFLKNTNSVESLFIYGFLIYIINEYFIPAPRYHYNSIQWIFPLLVMITSPVKNKKIYLILLLAFVIIPATKIPFNLSLAEILLITSSIYYIREQNKASENLKLSDLY